MKVKVHHCAKLQANRMKWYETLPVSQVGVVTSPVHPLWAFLTLNTLLRATVCPCQTLDTVINYIFALYFSFLLICLSKKHHACVKCLEDTVCGL